MVLLRSLVCLPLIFFLSLGACSKEEPPSAPYAVHEVPLSQISDDLVAGHTTAVEVTKAYIARIEKMDHALNAVILVAPDALDQAGASDKRRAAGQSLGPLDGIPILLKDNIDAIGMPTTAGSYALENNFPGRDSGVAERLRGAGAVILGKANTSQWAGLRTTGSMKGSTVGGVPHNPYDLDRTPGGSSSGPGIAAAVSFAAATVGTCTTGSVISPASLNGVVSMRPTIALISRRGIVPVSLTQDIAGPMARSVADTAMMLTVLAGSDAGDPASADADAHKTDYASGLDASSLRGARLGVLRNMRNYSAKTQPVFDAALEVLGAQGAELVEIPDDIFTDLSQVDRTILIYDFKEDLNAYLSGTPESVKVRNLAELIEFTKTDTRENIYGVDLFEAAQATTGGRQSPEYIKDLEYAKRKAGPEGYDLAMAEYGVSALVVLSRGPADLIFPPEDEGEAHPISSHSAGAAPPSPSMYAAIAGYPNLTVPMGLVDGLPVGLSFIGPKWSEQLLLSLGYAYEQASHARVPPTAYQLVESGS
jgi:amidase